MYCTGVKETNKQAGSLGVSHQHATAQCAVSVCVARFTNQPSHIQVNMKKQGQADQDREPRKRSLALVDRKEQKRMKVRLGLGTVW